MKQFCRVTAFFLAVLFLVQIGDPAVLAISNNVAPEKKGTVMYVEGLEITYGNGDIILNGRAPVEGNFPTPILTYDENELPENVAFFVEYDGATGTAWKTAIDLDTGEQIGTSPVNDDLTTMPGDR